MSIPRFIRRALGLLGSVAAAGFALGSPATAAPGRPHPHFNDRGTLPWYRDLGEAQQAARASGKLILIDYGRLACGNCRRLVEHVLPSASVRDRVGAVAVGLASDCDAADPRVEAIFQRGLPGAQMLPFVGLVTADLQWVTGWAGGIDPAGIGRQLSRCEPLVQRSAAPIAKAPAPRVAAPAASTPAPVRATPPPPAKATPKPAPVAATPKPSSIPAPAPSFDDFGDHGGGDYECKDGMCYLKPRVPAAAKVEPTPTAAPTPAAPPARIVASVTAPLPDPSPAAKPAPVAPPKASIPAPRVAVAPAPRSVSATPVARTTPPAKSSLPPAAEPARSKPVAPPVAKATTLVAKAREAAAQGRWGEVIRLGNDAEKAPPTTDSWEMDIHVRRARSWALDGMNDAVEAALKGDYDGAAKKLDRIRTAMAGLPVEIDAERGQRALLRLADIARGSPEASDSPDTARRNAYAEFRGTRWAVLFKAS